MERRAFLSALSAFAATAVLDPERLLWTRTKSIFIPPAPKLAFHKDAFDVDKWKIANAYISYDEGIGGSAAVLFSEEGGIITAIDEVHVKNGPLIFPSHWPIDRAGRITLSQSISKAEFRRRYPDSTL